MTISDFIDTLLISTIQGEAGADWCTDEERQCVANVIFNRTKQYYFSDGSLIDTILRPYQFSCWNGINYPKAIFLSMNNFIMARNIKALNLGKVDLTDGALLYYSPAAMNPANSIPSWVENCILTKTTRNFKFYKPIN